MPPSVRNGTNAATIDTITAPSASHPISLRRPSVGWTWVGAPLAATAVTLSGRSGAPPPATDTGGGTGGTGLPATTTGSGAGGAAAVAAAASAGSGSAMGSGAAGAAVV